MQGRPAGLSDDDSDDEYSSFSFNDENVKKPLNMTVGDSTSNFSNPVPLPKGSKFNGRSSVKATFADLDEYKQAIRTGDCSTIARALQHGIKVDQRLDNGWTGLLYASDAANADAVQLLLEKGSDVTFQYDGFSPLISLCANPESSADDVEKCAILLLQYGADPNASERHKMTPLIFASREGRIATVQKLLEAGANVNSVDYKNWTALTWACYKGHGSAARLLLEANADPSIVTVDGETASDIARMQNREKIACIVEVWANKQNSSGVSPEQVTVPNAITEAPKSEFPRQNDKIKYYGELEIVLSGLNLQHLLPVFREHSVDFVTFLQMDEGDLDRLNVTKVGERIKVLDAIKQIHKREWERSSLPALHLKKQITCPDAVAMFGNIGKQTRYMQASVGYLQDKIAKQPKILELGQEASDAHCLVSQAREAYQQTHCLMKKLGEVIRGFETMQDRVELQVADQISSTTLSMFGFKNVVGILLISFAATALVYSRVQLK